MSLTQVLFVQGGGAGVHDGWDQRLAESLGESLGEGFEVRYPRMPDEGDPSHAGWGPVIRDELADLPPGSLAVGHSVGATLLVQALVDEPVAELAALVLIAPPYVGEGGWPGEEFAFGEHVGKSLPAVVHLFWGTDDGTVPAAHLGLFERAIPQVHVHRIDGRDHQLGNDLTEVAQVVRRR